MEHVAAAMTKMAFFEEEDGVNIDDMYKALAKVVTFCIPDNGNLIKNADYGVLIGSLIGTKHQKDRDAWFVGLQQQQEKDTGYDLVIVHDLLSIVNDWSDGEVDESRCEIPNNKKDVYDVTLYSMYHSSLILAHFVSICAASSNNRTSMDTIVE